MKGLGGTSPFHRFTNPRRDKSVYFWSWGSYLLYNLPSSNEGNLIKIRSKLFTAKCMGRLLGSVFNEIANEG